MNGMEKISEQDMAQVVGGISQEEALDAALAYAELSKDQVDFIKKVELDWEHGRKIYEVTFYKGGFEYEFDVDAVTGKILKYEKERD